MRLRVCVVFKVFNIGKHIQVFDRIFVDIEFTMLSGFNALGCAAKS